MKVSRRGVLGGGVLAGALAVPTVAGLSGWQWRHSPRHAGDSLLLFDDTLEAGRRFATAGAAAGSAPVALEGDPIRLMQRHLALRPALIAGVSRHAHALLAIEAAAEAGYVLASEMLGNAQGCNANTCHAAWVPLSRMAVGAGPGWIEALAAWASNPQSRETPTLAPALAGAADAARESALGWVLVPR